MRIPDALSAALAAADDNYLIGLSNKGTLNRAKKDLAALSDPEMIPEGEGVRVRLGDVQCHIMAPLGESTCSCPSSAMCRHRIASILLLKTQTAEAQTPKSDFEALRQYPTEKLAKLLGYKRLAAALFRHESGGGPAIHESSVITVEMPWLPATVRLLEPVEHSTCTCHSKSFCLHKAEALLYWQLRQGVADAAALRASETGSDLDLQKIRGICRGVQESLTAQLTTGLSRMNPGICETVERMAALCHTAGLADLERALRRLHGEYAAYFARSATFRDADLLARLAAVFRLAAALGDADEELALQLAGSFRDDYMLVGDLRLYLLGWRDFTGRSGYAGTIYYFRERDGEKYYTFTHVRPTFYEGGPKGRSTAPAPWGLPCTLKQAWNCGIDLRGAKVSRTGNLSATEQCHALLLDRQNPGNMIPEEMLCRDFLSLLPRSIGAEVDRLALVHPLRCVPRPYDRVGQIYSMELLDEAGRDLLLEVVYKNEEAAVVNQLERLDARLAQEPDLRPVFFGIVYRDADRLKLYPIEYFIDWEGLP